MRGLEYNESCGRGLVDLGVDAPSREIESFVGIAATRSSSTGESLERSLISMKRCIGESSISVLPFLSSKTLTASCLTLCTSSTSFASLALRLTPAPNPTELGAFTLQSFPRPAPSINQSPPISLLPSFVKPLSDTKIGNVFHACLSPTISDITSLSVISLTPNSTFPSRILSPTSSTLNRRCGTLRVVAGTFEGSLAFHNVEKQESESDEFESG